MLAFGLMELAIALKCLPYGCVMLKIRHEHAANQTSASIHSESAEKYMDETNFSDDNQDM
jgi:hypothetical protein